MAKRTLDQYDLSNIDDLKELLAITAEENERLRRKMKHKDALLFLVMQSANTKPKKGGKSSGKSTALAKEVAKQLYEKKLVSDPAYPPGAAAKEIHASMLEHSNWFVEQSTDDRPHRIPSEKTLKKHLKIIAPPEALKPGRRKAR